MTDRSRSGSIRILLTLSVFLSAYGGLTYRLIDLQTGDERDSRRKELTELKQSSRKLDGARGRIYDRCGRDNVLAMDLHLKHLNADPSRIKPEARAATAATLARELDLDEGMILDRLSRANRKSEPIKKYLAEEEVKHVERLAIPGLFFDDTSSRVYPHEGMMCHVVGFVNREGVGSGGIEMLVNRLLTGSPGYIKTVKDGRDRELYDRRGGEVAPIEGADVMLCLDLNIQYAVEKALDAVMDESGALAAWAIVEDVRTGEILALASRPSFNLNAFYDAADDARLNRAIGTVYEPGSTIKAATIAGVLDAGLATENMIVDCENGGWFHAGRVLRDHHPNGRLTVAEVLQKSSNIGTAKLALRLGNQRLHNYFRNFGFGGQLGLDLPGEEAGILHATKNWSALSCSRIAIGQGIAVTALQMLNAACAIANDGALMQPRIIKRVVAKSGRVLYEGKNQKIRQVIRPETAALMRRLMGDVTEEGGTGTRAQVPGYTVAGKTGTAQKPENGGYSETKFIASFVGFLPVEDPRLGIIVVVDEPHSKSHFGGTVAAPAFREIAAEAVRYFNIPPSYEAETAVAVARR